MSLYSSESLSPESRLSRDADAPPEASPCLPAPRPARPEALPCPGAIPCPRPRPRPVDKPTPGPSPCPIPRAAFDA